jgi:hypothetical protein
MENGRQLKKEIDSWVNITPTWGTLKEHILQKMRVYNIDYSVTIKEPNVINYKSCDFDFHGKITLSND